jgi:putative ABC transport system substrate-binding protein
LETFHAGAAALAATAIEAPFHDAVEIESVLTNLGSHSDAGLVVMPGTSTAVHRELICALAARFRLPAIYPFRFFIPSGGLLSYGIDSRDLLRGAASYVDRILRGAKPSDLPVQLPTRFELVINLKAAKAIGLSLPQSLLVEADDVIE